MQELKLRRSAGARAGLLCVILSGCSGAQSALEVHGPGARLIADIWWQMLALGAAVYTIVAGAVILLLVRRRGSRAEARSATDRTPPLDAPDLRAPPRAMRWIVMGGVLLPILVLSPLFVSSVRTLRSITEDAGAGMTIRVTGHQYWWEISYRGAGIAEEIVTANEIHIPVGERVRLELVTADVIHSLWVPSLQGKIDLIPGRTNSFWIEADDAGIFRAQCAEYCGLQHTNMSLPVVAEPRAEFESWLASQRAPAAAAADSLAVAGERVFVASGCVSCHTIRGSSAGGTGGPDLTHLASRRTLAAGLLENNTNNLRRWIAKPQDVKRGSRMPDTPLSDAQLDMLVRYLESLH